MLYTLCNVLPTEGRQFKALFMSTMECISEDSVPTNPTKSLCNPTVFNTAVTRAQGLVVAVGNPYKLMKVETKMDTYQHCWKEYIYNCLINDTVLVPHGQRHGLEELKQFLQKKGKDFAAHSQSQLNKGKEAKDNKSPRHRQHRQLPVSGW